MFTNFSRFFLCGILGVIAGMSTLNSSASDSDETLFLREPTVSADRVAFIYARDLWIVGRDGGEARRLTVHPGVESSPHFSPDGKNHRFYRQL